MPQPKPPGVRLVEQIKTTFCVLCTDGRSKRLEPTQERSAVDVMRGEIVEAELGRLIVRRSVKEPRHTISEGGTVGSIDSRLRRLEESGGSCPECGLSAQERRPIAVVYPDDSYKGFEGDP